MKCVIELVKSQKEFYSSKMLMCYDYMCCCHEFDIKGESLDL